jgi:hypothetical protein
MKAFRFLAAAFTATALAACSGPRSRIKASQGEFDAYPPAVQQKIRAAQVDVGFTNRQVAMALGQPDRVYSRKTAGAQQEVWAYGGPGGGPRVVAAPELGMGTAVEPGFYSGVGLATDPEVDRGERVRVIFQDGLVVAVESRRR